MSLDYTFTFESIQTEKMGIDNIYILVYGPTFMYEDNRQPLNHNIATRIMGIDNAVVRQKK